MATNGAPQDGLEHQFHGSYHKQKLTAAMSNSNPTAPEHGGKEAFSGQSKQLYSRRSSQHLNLQKEISVFEKEYDKKVREVHKARCDISDESKVRRKPNNPGQLSSKTQNGSPSSSITDVNGNKKKAPGSTSDRSLVDQKFLSDLQGQHRDKYADHKRMAAVQRLSRISRYRATSPNASRNGTYVDATVSSHRTNRVNGNSNSQNRKGQTKGKSQVFERLSVDSSFSAMPSDLFLKQCQRKSMNSQKNRVTSNKTDFKY